jgi:hypothetical protein
LIKGSEKSSLGDISFFIENRCSFITDYEPTELTVLPQLVGLVIHSSFRYKEFLFEVSETLLPFFQLKAQFLVDF